MKILLTLGFEGDRDAFERALLRAVTDFVANGAAKRATIDVRAGHDVQNELPGVSTETLASAVVALWQPTSMEVAQGFPLPSDGRVVGAYRVDEVVQKEYDWSSTGVVTPGVKMICFVRRRPDLDHEAFSRHWRERHGPLAVARQPAFWHYVQNHVALRLTPDTPDFDGIGEIHCRSTYEALQRSFDSEEGKRLIYADTRRFMDHARSTVLVTQEHVVA
ncbi:MAG TPA: EthD domain-containing protein [Myxococcota bacterium]|nr:EthD domain-containing protein [Myxococcota bacterium]